MAENEQAELMEVEALVKATNAIAVSSPVRAALIQTLVPIAARMRDYSEFAANVKVSNKMEADRASEMDARVATDIKVVEKDDVLSKIIRGLDQLHDKAVAIRGMFIDPMKEYRKAIRQPVLDWEADEKRKADEITRKAQAATDAKAAREREKVEAEARRQRELEDAARRQAEDARRKAEAAKGAERDRLQAAANAADRRANAAAEKAEVKAEQAAAVVAPTVTVEALKSGLRTAKVWKVKSINEEIFFAALAVKPDLWGFADANLTRLERAKAANPSMACPGIEFEQIIR